MDDTKQTTTLLPALNPSVEQALQMPIVGNAIAAATRAKPGQPTKRSPEIVDTILDRVACGESLMSVCQDPALPGYSTFNRWCREDPELLEQVDIAYEFHARTMDDIADDILAGGPTSTGDFYRDKERVAHLRWRLGKLNRRRYGDKVQMDVVTHQPVILDLGTIEGEGGDGV
ncbi:hypothetical protein IFT67_12480 [Sphingomonas sp. CFBP 13728]|uniref:terminase small subunit-like protein n=1 Tax=Sphingomonas sp. CFBP 13728 TaxID=2775294 RepID=UPI00178308BB|nr:hypothetical protein [Sphingomonas sp. CFBP 13728]MBD8619738.1 hypothetical protein [Sphingomonas sp. CFBP 13728]